MKIYAAIWEDRHVDTSVYLFSDADEAVEWARRTCKESDRHGDSYQEFPVDGWLFNAHYSCESDGIHVVGVELDAEV